MSNDNNLQPLENVDVAPAVSDEQRRNYEEHDHTRELARYVLKAMGEHADEIVIGLIGGPDQNGVRAVITRDTLVKTASNFVKNYVIEHISKENPYLYNMPEIMKMIGSIADAIGLQIEATIIRNQELVFEKLTGKKEMDMRVRDILDILERE